MNYAVLIVLVVSIGIAYFAGRHDGAESVTRESIDAAAAACPTCHDLVVGGAVDRFVRHQARVSGVEWYGGSYGDAERNDRAALGLPCDDANEIIAAAIRHQHRRERNRIRALN